MNPWDPSLLVRPASSATLNRSTSSTSTDDGRGHRRLGSVYSACTYDVGGGGQKTGGGGGHFSEEAVDCLDELLSCCADEWKADDRVWLLEQDEGRMQWEGHFTHHLLRSSTKPARSNTEALEQIRCQKEEAVHIKQTATSGRKAAEARLRQLLSAKNSTSSSLPVSAAGKHCRTIALNVKEGQITLEKLGVAIGSGLTVSRVQQGTEAESQGVAPGARIVEINHKPVSSKEDVVSMLLQNQNTELVLTVAQSGSQLTGEGFPEGLFVTPPPSHSQCAGWYGRALGQTVNGYPVWERCDDNDSRWYLYATQDGRWAVASSQYDMANHLADLQTESYHNGSPPTEFNGSWLENTGSHWVPVAGMRVTPLAVPVSERIPSTTLVVSKSKSHGKVDRMSGLDVDDSMIVLSVQPGSAGERAGILPGSRVLAVDGLSVNSKEEMEKALKTKDENFCVTVAQPAYADRDTGVSMSMCPNKNNSDSYALLESTTALRDFGDKIVSEWHGKKSNVLEELAANLVVPPGKEPMKAIAEAAFHLHRMKGAAYPDKNLAELLVMAIYTMAGPDIDALMGFEGVPVFQGEMPAEWIAYTSEKKDRNGAVFSAINWASRTASAPKNKDTDEAWGTLKKWVKYLGLLAALSCEERGGDGIAVYERLDGDRKGWVTREEIRLHMKKYPAVRSRLGSKSIDWDEGTGNVTKDEFLELWKKADPGSNTDLIVARGIAGLPADVFKAHNSMGVGSTLSWPAPASCAFDRAVSEAYIRGEAINAVRHKGGSILFLIENSNWGLPLQAISKYPKEAELLLPPLTTFEIKRIKEGTDHGLEGVLIINLECASVLGASSLRSFTNECREDAAIAAMEIAHVLAGGPAHGLMSIAPGTPVEVRTQSNKKGTRWERATVLESTPDGYIVEWPEWNAEGGIKQAFVTAKDMRVLPVSSKLKSILLEGGLLDTMSGRYVTREVDVDKEIDGLHLIGTVVDKVEPNSNAARAGILPGSKILKIGDDTVSNEESVYDALEASQYVVTATLLVPSAAARLQELEAEVNAQPTVQKTLTLKKQSAVDGLKLVGSTVVSVVPGSEAEKTGFCAGCRIITVDGSASCDVTRQLSDDGSRVEVLFPEARIAEQDVAELLAQQASVKRAVTLPPSSGALGINLMGNTITSLIPGSVAERAGLAVGNKVLLVNGEEITSPSRQLSDPILSQQGAELVVLASSKEEESATLMGLQMTYEQRTAVLTREEEGFGLGLHGLAVVEVHASSPAGKAGIPVGSVIVSVDNVDVHSSDDVVDALAAVNGSCCISFLVPPQQVSVKDKVETSPEEQTLSLSIRSDQKERTLGLTLRGTTIVSVTPGSNAEQAGLTKGSVLREVNGVPIQSEREAASELIRALKGSATSCQVVARLPKPAKDANKEALFATQKELASLKDKHMNEVGKHISEASKLRREYSDACEELAVLKSRPSDSQAKKMFQAELEERDKEKDAAKREAKRLQARVQSLEAALQQARSQPAPARAEDPQISAIISNLKDELAAARQERDTAVSVSKQKSMSVENEMLRKMWTEVKAMHTALDSIMEIKTEQVQQPTSTTQMRQEVDGLRQRVRKARHSTPPPRHTTPPSRVQPSPFKDLPKPAQHTTFARFGLSLSEALRTANGTIDYSGVRVVEAAAPAAPALKQGDMITHVNGVLISSLEDFRCEVETATPGTTVIFTTRRWMDGMIQHESVRVQASVTKRVPGSPGGMNFVQMSERDGCNVVNVERRDRSNSRGRKVRKKRPSINIEDPVRMFKESSPTTSPTHSLSPVRRTSSPRSFYTPAEYLKRAIEVLNDPMEAYPSPTSPSPERGGAFLPHYGSAWETEAPSTSTP